MKYISYSFIKNGKICRNFDTSHYVLRAGDKSRGESSIIVCLCQLNHLSCLRSNYGRWGLLMYDMTNNNHHIWPHLLAPDPHCSSRTIVSLLSIFVICEIKSGILLTFDGARPRVWAMYYVPCRSWLALSHTRSVWLGKARSHMIHTLVTGLDSRGDQLYKMLISK